MNILPKSRIKINHVAGDCPRVFQRIVCDKCGYPLCEAQFANEDEWFYYQRTGKDWVIEQSITHQKVDQ